MYLKQNSVPSTYHCLPYTLSMMSRGLSSASQLSSSLVPIRSILSCLQRAMEGDVLSVLCVVSAGAFSRVHCADVVNPASLWAFVRAHPAACACRYRRRGLVCSRWLAFPSCSLRLRGIRMVSLSSWTAGGVLPPWRCGSSVIPRRDCFGRCFLVRCFVKFACDTDMSSFF